MRTIPVAIRLFVLLLLSPIVVAAQDWHGKIEFGLGVGVAFPVDQDDISAQPTQPLERKSNPPGYYVNFKYFPLSRFTVGGTLGLRQSSGNSNLDWNYQHSTVEFTFKETSFVFAPEVSWLYFKHEITEFYSLVGYGIRYNSVRYSFDGPGNQQRPIPSTQGVYQITPFGFRFGDELSTYIELGWGYKGLFNVGVTYRPGRNFGHRRKKTKLHFYEPPKKVEK